MHAKQLNHAVKNIRRQKKKKSPLVSLELGFHKALPILTLIISPHTFSDIHTFRLREKQVTCFTCVQV